MNKTSCNWIKIIKPNFGNIKRNQNLNSENPKCIISKENLKNQFDVEN